MKHKLAQIFTDKNFYILIIIAMIFFGIFIKTEYATDTYCVVATDTIHYCQHFLYSGRPISALFLFVTRSLGFGTDGIYLTSFLIAIISTIASIYILLNIFKNDIKSEIISIIISVLTIINLFSIELYLFLEKGILMLSVLFCVLAFKQFVSYLQKGNTKYIIYTFIYMLFANFSYQGTVGLFVILACLYIVKNDSNLKTFLKNNFYAAICYGIPALINYLIVKFIFNNSRVSNKFDIQKSIKLIIENTGNMLSNTYNIIPKNIFLGTLIILSLMLLFTILIRKGKIKDKVLLLLKAIYLIVAIYVVTVFPQILQSTESIGFAPRNTYTFASILGILLFYIIVLQKNIKKNIIVYISILVSVIFIIIQYVNFLEVERNRYILNYVDYYNALQIQEKVNDYEEETGNTIKKVAVYKENGNSGSYPNLWLSGDINIKATTPDWSRIDYLEIYLNRELEKAEEDEEVYDLYFKDKNWKFFDTDQIILINDTMHFCMY